MRTKFIPQLTILILATFSCNQIATKVVNDFLKINDEILDSIGIVTESNSVLIENLGINKTDSFMMNLYDPIISHNQLIDSTINLIIRESSITNLETPSKYLIEHGMAELIGANSMKLKKKLKLKLKMDSDIEVIIEKISPNRSNSSIGDENWVLNQFNQLPVFACIPILNKWKLENLKVINELLIHFNQEKN